MGILLAVVGGLSAIVLVVLMVLFAKRLNELATAMAELQTELLPALEAIQETSADTQRLASLLEERAGALRRDRG
jgi:Sec-independent protein translocase protein TatA